MRKAFQASAVLVLLSAILFVSSVGPSDSTKGTLKPSAITAQVLAAKDLPLEFIPNAGQTDSRVSFYIKGSDRTVYFTPDGVTLALYKEPKAEQPRRGELSAGPREKNSGPARSWIVKTDFIGAQKNVVPEGLDKTGAVFSFFKGSRNDWHAGLPGYRRIVYRDLWPGIDLVYKGEVGRLKYEFIVSPGADPGLIQLGIRGAKDVAVDMDGRLVVDTPIEKIIDEKPFVYQENRAGEQNHIEAAYKLEKTGRRSTKVGFSMADYDQSLPLVIDPATLIYCGYIGGSHEEWASGIAVDGSGSAYITGTTFSDQTTFPIAAGPDLIYNSGYGDVFVAKVNAAGTSLVYCGYIGGSEYTRAYGIAVDGSGNAYITGVTGSDQTTFPVTVGPDLTFNGSDDVFVAKVNAAGTGLVYCGYIGGSRYDYGRSITVDGSGNAYVTGNTASDQASFPVAVGPDTTFNGGISNAFAAKINASGTGLVYCGYIGGSVGEAGYGIAVDGSGNAYVTRYTASDQASFPVAVGPDLTYNGKDDIFVAKVNAEGTGLVYCGYIGGSREDYGFSIAVDSLGNAYITGYTFSNEATFPVLIGPDLKFNGSSTDAYVAKVNASGTGLVYCGYIGGSGNDYGSGIAVDSLGNAGIVGNTSSDENTFPVAGGPDLTFNGANDAFVAKVEASGAGFVYCGYIGGSSVDSAWGIALDGAGNAYIAGNTGSDQRSFPVTVGPDLTYNSIGYGDTFVAKISPAGYRMADLSLAKSADNIRPFVDDTVTFTVTATNLGPRDATGVKVADKLPAGLSFVSSDVTRGTYDPASGLWTIGNLGDQTSAALTLRARGDKDGTIINTAVVAAMSESDPDLLNNEASVTLMAEYRLYAPANFQLQRLENDFIFYKEYINRLTWTANPLNRGVIVSYRLYRKPKGQPDDSFVFYKEFDVSLTSFDDRGLKKDDLFSYRLTSMNDKGRESEPVELVEGGVEHDRLAPRPGRRIFIPPLIIRPDHKQSF